MERHRGVRLRWTRAATVLVGALVLLPIAACGSPKMKTTAGACTPTSDSVLKSIGEKLEVPGELRNSRTVSRSGTNFISAELHEPDDKPETKGELLTWATAASSGAGFVAVDVRARENSGWPDATFDVRSDGAMLSRACADEIRGEVPCPGQASAVNVPSGFGGRRDRCEGGS